MKNHLVIQSKKDDVTKYIKATLFGININLGKKKLKINKKIK